MSADARTLNFQELLTNTATACGLDPENLGSAEGKALANQLTVAVKREWREDEWPASIRTEERTLWTEWSPEEFYAVGEIVTDIDEDGEAAYFQCIQAIESSHQLTLGAEISGANSAANSFDYQRLNSTRVPVVGDIIMDNNANFREVTEVIDLGGDYYRLTVSEEGAGSEEESAATLFLCIRPWEEVDYWTEVETFAHQVELAADGETVMLDVLSVWDADPDTSETAQSVSYHLTHDAVIFPTDAPQSVWIRFRKAPPRFSISLWSSSGNYSVGDLVVVWPHCYEALQASTGAPQGPVSAPARWEAQTLSELLGDIVRIKAAQEWLKSNGRYAQAGALKAELMDAEDTASRTLSRQQGQGRRFAVANGKLASQRRQFQPRRMARR